MLYNRINSINRCVIIIIFLNTEQNISLMDVDYRDNDFFYTSDNEDSDDNGKIVDGNKDPNNAQNNSKPSNAMRSNFFGLCGYFAWICTIPWQFSTRYQKLLHILWSTECSLKSYDEMFWWHVESSNLLRPHKQLSESRYFVSRDHIYGKVRDRYNCKEV